MRGKDRFLPGHAPDMGITPAYAGKREDFEGLVNVYRDHPRVCGEK